MAGIGLATSLFYIFAINEPKLTQESKKLEKIYSSKLGNAT